MRKALAAVLLGSLALLVSPTPAFAHAELVTSSPRNGSQLLVVPKNITLNFGENVSLVKAQILDQTGATVPATASLTGSHLTVTPNWSLLNGRYAVSWQVTSDDDHTVAGAIAFTVKIGNPRGKPTALALMPAVKAHVSAAAVGARTITFVSNAKSGEVLLKNDALPGPITWRVTGDGKIARASGVIPIAGVWTIEASLFAGAIDFLVAKGTQTFQ